MKKTDKYKQLLSSNLGWKRFTKYVQRLRKRGKKGKDQLGPYTSVFLGELSPITSNMRGFVIKKKLVTVKIPKEFSFYSNPDEVIGILNSLSKLLDGPSFNNIYFNHYDCKILDLSASAIMDITVMEIRKVMRRSKRKINFTGLYPADKTVQETLQETGLIEHLDIKHERLPAWIRERFIRFKLQSGGLGITKAKKSSRHEQTATDLSDYFARCVKRQNCTITETGQSYIMKMVTEVLENVEAHSDIKKWYVIGYMRQDEENSVGECNIAIFNLGLTIYETISGDKTRRKIKRQMKILTKKHRKLFGNAWDEKSLLTLYALQEGVSCLPKDPSGKDRGNGMMELFKFFYDLGSKKGGKYKPRLCIISGSSMIKYDGKYNMKPEKIGFETRKIIAFNKKNSLYEPPDPEAVRRIKSYFPGTIIDMKFVLDKEYLEKIS